MHQHDWRGVLPAVTTPFLDNLAVDHPRLATHVRWLTDHGCAAIVALGSLGEAATLTFDEKISILETCKRAVGRRSRSLASLVMTIVTRDQYLAELVSEVLTFGAIGPASLPS